VWGRDRARILDELDDILDTDDARLAAGFQPIAAEHHFAGVEVKLPSGHVLELRGSIDRVDRRPDGGLEVLDYKTGNLSAKDKALSADEPHGNGERLQLYLYARAAERDFPTPLPVSAHYWFTKHDEFPGYEVTADVAARVEDVIDQIVESIATGLFPARPPAKPSWGYVDCWFCRPDGLSATERRREWERKRLAPELHDYLALCEPEVLE
jgi:ATP-dependent helicase/nuclease subunit B